MGNQRLSAESGFVIPYVLGVISGGVPAGPLEREFAERYTERLHPAI
jgi:hypothetical protein